MNQQVLWHDDIYQALETDCKAIAVAEGYESKAWAKVVGNMLWPEKSPDAAGKFLNNCLDQSHAQKIEIQQVLWIMKKAREIGSYATMYFMSDETSFTRPEPTLPEDEEAKLMRDFNTTATGLQKMLQRIERLREGQA